MLDAIARALQLAEAEHAHLHDLARAANTTPHTRRRPAPKQQIRPVVQRILDGIPRCRRSSSTGVWTCWRPTGSESPCTHRCMPTRPGR